MVTNVKAFPNMTNQTGMDLRDYFAAKAMQAFIVRKDFEFESYVWENAYDIADAMMKARGIKTNEYQTQSAPTSRQPSDPSSW
jgi:hypothetical protein